MDMDLDMLLLFYALLLISSIPYVQIDRIEAVTCVFLSKHNERKRPEIDFKMVNE